MILCFYFSKILNYKRIIYDLHGYQPIESTWSRLVCWFFFSLILYSVYFFFLFNHMLIWDYLSLQNFLPCPPKSINPSNPNIIVISHPTSNRSTPTLCHWWQYVILKEFVLYYIHKALKHIKIKRTEFETRKVGWISSDLHFYHLT